MGLITHIVQSGVVRPTNANSVLKTHLLKPVQSATFVKDEFMADERDLLWSEDGALMKP